MGARDQGYSSFPTITIILTYFSPSLGSHFPPHSFAIDEERAQAGLQVCHALAEEVWTDNTVPGNEPLCPVPVAILTFSL